MEHYALSPDFYDTANQTEDNYSCEPVQIAVPDIVDNPSIHATFGLLYSLIWLFGVFGNLTVLYVVVLRKVDFTVRTIFIVSLCCSDLIIAFTSLPITAITTFSRIWILAHFLCYAIGFVQASSVFVSSFTLITIAVDRYYLIHYPHSVRITYEKAKILVFAFWCIGALFAIPMSAFMKIENYPGVCGDVCTEEWPHGWTWGRRTYGLAVVSIQYGLPLIVCSTLYVKISYRIRKQYDQRLLSQGTVSATSAARCLIRRRRTNRMMALMMASFVLAWLPINVVNLARDFELIEHFLHYFTFLFALGHLAAMSSIIWNPIIYSFFNYKFRRAVKSFIGVRGSNRTRPPSDRNTTMM